VSLTDPAGQTFTGPNAAAGVSELRGPTFDVYRVTNPAPGKWTLHLTGVDIAAGGEQVAVRTTQVPPGGVTAFVGPSAAASASPTTGAARLRVRFRARSPTPSVTYRWLFGDGATATGASPRHTYRRLGVYHPALAATGANGLQTFAATRPIRVTGATIRDLKITPRTFKAAATGRTLRTLPRHTTELITGAIISYTEAQRAKTIFTIQRPAAGRREGRSCAKPSKHNRKHRRCVRYLEIGSFRHADKRGKNRFPFTGRIRGHKVAPGPYRLQAIPRNGAGAGPTAHAHFRIIP
jgi:hypothetical protein